MARECVVDTTVLQKANAALTAPPREHALFRHRVRLLGHIRDGQLTVLMSDRLLAEYRRQVKSPRNDYIRAFFEILDDPTRHTRNWEKRWGGGRQEPARKCRYPEHDDHVLRTAIRPGNNTTIFSEDKRMLDADACIYGHFRVHIHDPSRIDG